MTNDYDQIEEKLKEEVVSKNKAHKVSGRSVFKLQEIIKEKSSAAYAMEDKTGDKESDGKENPEEDTLRK